MNDPALLLRSIAQLSLDDRFKVFIGQLQEMKNAALAEAVSNRTLENHAVLAGYMGEIRCYSDIIALYDDALTGRLEITEPHD